MTIEEIKSKLEISTLHLNTSQDSEGNPTMWLRHWDNDTRRAVSIHKELFDELKKDININTLGLQEEVRSGSKGDYTAYRIVKFLPAEYNL